MTVLIDTNVVLDVLLDRPPFVEPAVRLFSLVEAGALSGALCATTVTTIHYLAAKAVGAARAEAGVRQLLELFEVAPVTRGVLEGALALGFGDFEDAVFHEAARGLGAAAIATRNKADFRRASLPVYAPDELLTLLSAGR